MSENCLAIDLKGKMYLIKDTQTFESGFKKREFILSVDETNNSTGAVYTQYIPLEAIKDNCSKLDNFSIGETVEVSVNLRGRLYKKDENSEEKAFLNLTAWRIYRVIEELNIQNEIEGGEDANTGDEDLPF